ncbi:MAG: hypothetical protein J7K87_04575 [Candidatus Aenigmarchaeota archaeon]|nr:hypothetical protein [Candidatus Aenigmarchaeota archaeon]
MKDIVLQFKNFLYRKRESEDEKRELLRDLEELARWGELTQSRNKDKIKAIRLVLEIRFDE